MMIWKFSFAPTQAKFQLFKSYFYPIMDVLIGVIWRYSYQYSIFIPILYQKLTQL